VGLGTGHRLGSGMEDTAGEGSALWEARAPQFRFRFPGTRGFAFLASGPPPPRHRVSAGSSLRARAGPDAGSIPVTSRVRSRRICSHIDSHLGREIHTQAT
jgi:hypothetical protein